MLDTRCLFLSLALAGCGADTDRLPAPLREAARRPEWLARHLEGTSPARRVIDVALPPSADGVLHVADRDSAVAVDVRLSGARAVPGQAIEEWIAYPQGHALGTFYQRVTDEGTEDFLWLERPPAESRLVYEMWPGSSVAGLRLVEDSLELLDRSGAPRLRVPTPWVQGADGARRAAQLAVEGCAVDRDPRPPFGRAPTAAGAERCELVVSWSSEGLRLPALVDPAWVTTANMITARYGHTTTSLTDDRVLVVGGMTASGETAKVEIYDPRSESWTGVAPVPGVRQGHTATRLGSGDVLVVGGHYGTTYRDDAQRYSGGVWFPDGTISGARTWHTSTLLSPTEVLIVGGYDGVALATSPKYSAGTWTSPPGLTLSEARYDHTATLIGGRVLVVGGQGTSSALASAERTNTAVTAWGTAGSLLDGVGRRQHTATLMPSGQVMVAGGYDGVATYPATTYLYDPAPAPSGGWSDAGTLTAGGRRAHVAALMGNKVLVAGGTNASSFLGSYQLFEEPSTWTFVPSSGPARTFAGAVTLPLGTVLVVGGNGFSGAQNTASVYNPSTSTTALTASTTARADHTATELADRRIFVYGGQVAGSAVALPRIYDPATFTWTTVTYPFFVTARKRHTATLLDDGRVLLAGGDGGGAPTTGTNYYWPGSSTFSSGPSMTAARAGHAAVKLPGGKVLFTGGDGPLTTAEVWDPMTGGFSAVLPMSVGRKEHTATLLAGGTVLVAGGDAATPSTSQIYNPVTGIWASAVAMSGQRFGHQAVLLPGTSEAVLTVGGKLAGGTVLDSVDRYDVAMGTWATVFPMFAPRRRHGAVRLTDGRVLVTGGNNSNTLAGTEVYDPATNTWTAGAQLQVGRAGHTASLLPGGRVLIALGGTPFGALSQCELYTP